MLESYQLIIMYAKLLQDNKRYNSSVQELREADYIVNTMIQMKRDLLAQGLVADHLRVAPFFSAKWQYWTLKWRYTCSMTWHALENTIVSKIYSAALRCAESKNPLRKVDQH